MTNNATQLANDAGALINQLRGAGATSNDLKDIEEARKMLAALSSTSAYKDPAALNDLAQTALNKLKKWELDIRKKLDMTSDQLYLTGADQVPKSFQSVVDEYFKKLSAASGKGKGKGGSN